MTQINWQHFIFFALAALILWAAGAWGAWKNRPRATIGFTAAGLLVFLAYIILMWVSLERPPLRTMGETRLWYSLFLPLAGIMVYSRWHYRWILTFSTIMAAVFIGINLLKPEIHSKTLMPALQSPWFAPHVIVYMFAYALLGAAFLTAVWLLITAKRNAGRRQPHPVELEICDNLVMTGLSFMTLGMLMGALWAKEAWGHYWAWDPKETWAAVTWFAFLAYIHLRRYAPARRTLALWLLVAAFLLLQMCWWGINYLPSAQATSVHTYTLD